MREHSSLLRAFIFLLQALWFMCSLARGLLLISGVRLTEVEAVRPEEMFEGPFVIVSKCLI